MKNKGVMILKKHTATILIVLLFIVSVVVAFWVTLYSRYWALFAFIPFLIISLTIVRKMKTKSASRKSNYLFLLIYSVIYILFFFVVYFNFFKVFPQPTFYELSNTKQHYHQEVLDDGEIRTVSE